MGNFLEIFQPFAMLNTTDLKTSKCKSRSNALCKRYPAAVDLLLACGSVLYPLKPLNVGHIERWYMSYHIVYDVPPLLSPLQAFELVLWQFVTNQFRISGWKRLGNSLHFKSTCFYALSVYHFQKDQRYF